MFLVFGGFSAKSEIVQYNPGNDEWTKLGSLNAEGFGHDVITSRGAFLIIGKSTSSEKCELTGTTIKCFRQEPDILR